MPAAANYVDGPASVDFALGGNNGISCSGNVAQRLLANGMNTNVLKPYIGARGQVYITVNDSEKPGKWKAVPVNNAPGTLGFREWMYIDEAVVRAAFPRMQAWADLRRSGNQLIIPNGMGKTVLEYSKMGDITPATISMSPLRESERDRPTIDYAFLPLPIIHKDFWFDIREIESSRGGRMPLDSSSAELAARRVAEAAEQLTVGVASSFTYGGGTVYGYINFPQRTTQAMTLPTAGGWNGAVFINEILAMLQAENDHGFYGPFNLYFSSAWGKYLGADYSAAKGDLTLQERTGRIQRIAQITTLDYLTAYQAVMVNMTSDVARAVVGQDITTVQWDSDGGFRVNFKVLAILVPHLRADINGNCGIVHAVAA